MIDHLVPENYFYQNSCVSFLAYVKTIVGNQKQDKKIAFVLFFNVFLALIELRIPISFPF